jgi:NAD(P)-dependent dehydrogenase (short-subunit alcohol dehydrogenase family)
MRNRAGQTILITGATDGLGRALAGALASRGATVLVHGRSDQRLEATLRGIRRATSSERGRRYHADLASLDEVRRLGRDVTRDVPRLDVLVNNAGIGFGRRGAPREESADGYELRFAVNYLAPFLLTHLLLPLLERSVPARVVNVASAGQAPVDFEDPMLTRRYDGVRAYCQSKLALVAFTVELAQRLAARGAGVTVNALHPATFMDTKMVREFGVRPTSTVQQGLEATLRLVLSPELEGVSGRYFDGLREARAEAQAYDPEARRALWRLSEECVAAARP